MVSVKSLYLHPTRHHLMSSDFLSFVLFGFLVFIHFSKCAFWLIALSLSIGIKATTEKFVELQIVLSRIGLKFTAKARWHTKIERSQPPFRFPL